MTSEQIRELALKLYTIVFECEGVAELAIWQRCLRTCRSWDVEPPMAILISEALTGYLADGGRPQTSLVTPLAKAQAVLHQTVGASYDEEPSACPAWTRLTPSAIAAMVGWVLIAVSEHPVNAGTDARVTRADDQPHSP
jgi:hypothetical protein